MNLKERAVDALPLGLTLAGVAELCLPIDNAFDIAGVAAAVLGLALSLHKYQGVLNK